MKKALRWTVCYLAIAIPLSVAVGKWFKRNRINSYGDLVPRNDPSR